MGVCHAVKNSNQLTSQSLASMSADQDLEMLNENQITADATAEAQLVAQEEAMLDQKVKIQEQENEKFLEIVSRKDIELMQEEENEPKEDKPSFKPNVYEVYDAATGKLLN